ncbi:MAG: hypothetical protein F6K30_28655 [Cyanothece sp. SIO2G6]|nr:hypothetical protein [Cyanothece sp. SIO2G6]
MLGYVGAIFQLTARQSPHQCYLEHIVSISERSPQATAISLHLSGLQR